MTPESRRDGNCYILFDADRATDPGAIPFDHRDSEPYEPVAGAGRGGAWRVRVDGTVAALRQYRRGGLVANLLRSSYLWTGVERTRAFREWRLLARLHSDGLPVPAPIAARVVRTAWWYRAEIMTEWLADTRSLVTLLGESEPDPDMWRRIGATLRAFHRAGVFHADLNAHNVLIDRDERVFLIDFDRGALRDPAGRWTRANLTRLRRSLEKVHATGAALYYTREGWNALLDGYANAPVQRS